MNKELGELIKRNALNCVSNDLKEMIKMSFKPNYDVFVNNLYKSEKEKYSEYLKLVKLKNKNYAFVFYDGTFLEEDSQYLNELELKKCSSLDILLEIEYFNYCYLKIITLTNYLKNTTVILKAKEIKEDIKCIIKDIISRRRPTK